MNTIALSATPRTDLGTKYAAQLRRTKQVPCVLYGGETNLHFSVDGAALKKVIFTPELNGVEIEMAGRKILAMVKDKQFHPVTDEILHVDFVELDESEEAAAELTLRLIGQAIGVRKGGKLRQNLRKVRVSGLPAKMPGHLELDIADLDINKTIHVSDLKFEGLTVLENEDEVVVAVKMAKKQEEAAAGAAAPAADAKKAEAKK
ncbi:MAG TPA: 50S ribosomal protein L25 [Flavobacteriales bacterium]|nr:50S ribosomal protein L25 [Flavobacteriales bacterium]HNU56032.1 50S ribosomal protein L25 [Flavobacteriales bacterium]